MNQAGGSAFHPSEGTTPSYDVFISHKSEHKPWVEWLSRSLQAAGRTVFLDIWNLVPGDSWVEGLHRGLQRSRAAVLVATPDVVNSGWVREEFNAFQSRRQSDPTFRLIPIAFGHLPNLPFLANLQAVDFRDPSRYRESLYKLLCGLEAREPGSEVRLEFPIDPPPPIRAPEAGDMVPGEQRFVQRVMARLSRPGAPPLMITARGRRHQGPVIQALMQRGREIYGEDALLHVTPPFSELASEETCFRELGRQCGFAEDSPEATAFSAALDRRLHGGARLFLLVTGFENANAAGRTALAGVLRTLTEMHPQGLRVVLLGGQRLMEQKYAAGTLSFLSHATVDGWPDPTLADVLAWQRQEFPQAPLDEAQAHELVEASGGHAGLVRYCLECLEAEGGNPNWGDCCYRCPELWETWNALSRQDADLLRQSLERETFGPALPWPPDTTARRLYWADLLAGRHGRLAWRAEVARQVGRELLA